VTPNEGSAAEVGAACGDGVAGVVLAGGFSRRMGTAKAALEWHGSTLLRRTTGVLARVVDGQVLVVRAPGQQLPALPASVLVVDDPEPGLGPVVGLAAGLAASSRAGAARALVAATDLPFLHPAYLHRVLTELAGPYDVVLPVARCHAQPLAAAYRTAVSATLEEMAATGEYRLRALFDRCRVLRLDESALLADPTLATLDPALDSLTNVNAPEEYAEARARPAPLVTAVVDDQPRRVAAATVAELAAACGLPLPADQDGEYPLVTGDRLRLR
jgi:molybdopterin-guanine dinucleotide biosynthesis protein A